VQKSPAASVTAKAHLGQTPLYAALTLILTIATVWGGRIGLRHFEIHLFATGEPGGVERRFANKLTG
jgi:hypothetical protein